MFEYGKPADNWSPFSFHPFWHKINIFLPFVQILFDPFLEFSKRNEFSFVLIYRSRSVLCPDKPLTRKGHVIKALSY